MEPIIHEKLSASTRVIHSDLWNVHTELPRRHANQSLITGSGKSVIQTGLLYDGI